MRRLCHTPVHREFQIHLSKKGVPEHMISFDDADARRRIREAVLLPYVESFERHTEIAGETDGDTIWVVRGLFFEDMVETEEYEEFLDSKKRNHVIALLERFERET